MSQPMEAINLPTDYITETSNPPIWEDDCLHWPLIYKDLEMEVELGAPLSSLIQKELGN